MSEDLESIAAMLVADGKGILAADESVPTLTKRFDTLGVQSTEESRRTYREMLFTAGVSEHISGAIMCDETSRQKSSRGTPLAQVLSSQGILPGIKVDTGAKPLAGLPDETVIEGAGPAAGSPRGVPRHGRPLREVAGRHPRHGHPAELRVREGECARPSGDTPRSVRSSTSCRSSSPKS